MIKYTFNTITGDQSIEPSFGVSDVAQWLGRLFGAKDAYLDYSVSAASQAYDNGQINWVHQVDDQGGRVPLGYHLVHDYRRHPSSHSWGQARIVGNYAFPADLVEHREAMIARMLKEKRIKHVDTGKPKDSRCPRVSSLGFEGGLPQLEVQIASYLGQVGTNLTLDCPLPKSLSANGKCCTTVREWDRAQAHLDGPGLPDWDQSRLANTIGVAVGLSARSATGVKNYIYRFRTPKAPVFPNTWHVPVSFALEIDESVAIGQTHEIRDLILKDLPEELYAEAELNRRDFHPLRPLALCRELARGGKPQFFCELESKVPLEQLIGRIGRRSPEYTKQPRQLPEGQALDIPMSPELACFLALKSGALDA